MNFLPLKDFLHHLTDDIGIPSVDIRLHRDGKELYSYGCGKSFNKETPLYNMYSVSKPITCAAALQLMEKGKFMLETPLYDFFPEFKEMSVKRTSKASEEGKLVASGAATDSNDENLETEKAKKPILVRHLFTMGAGFNYDTNTPIILKYKEASGGRFPTLLLAKALSEQPLEFEPGTHWRYSLCHDMLGALIELISGQKLSDYIREHIFEPLEMTNSTFEPTKKVLDAMLPQFRYNTETKTASLTDKSNHLRIGTEYDSGGAGIISSVDDYIKFADSMAFGGTSPSGERILSKSSVELMHTNQLSPKVLPDLNWEQLLGYGYGLGVRTLIDRATAGALSPIGEFGWGGAAGAYLMIDPTNRISVCYGQHMLNNLEPYVHTRLRNIVYGCIL